MAAIEDFILRFRTQGTDQIKKVSQDVQNLRKDVEAFGEVGGPLGNTINGLVGRFGLLGAAVAGAAGLFVTLGLRAIDAADQLQDLSDATGISSSKLLNLKQSIVEAGGDLDSFQKVATKLSVAVGEAATGNEKAKKSFKELGVFVTDSSGALRSNNDILDDAIAALAKIEDPAVRNARAFELLGKEAAKIDWTKVKAGKDAITDEQIKQLAEYRGELDKLQNSIERVLIESFGKLAKAINEIGKQKPEKGSVLDILSMPFELGFELGRQGNLKTQREQAVAGGLTPEEIAQENQRLAGRKPMTGGFGGPSEAQLKALEDSKKRIRESGLAAQLQDEIAFQDAYTEMLLVGANERMAAEIKANNEIVKLGLNAAAEIEKARININANTLLTEEARAKEFAAKEKEINSKLANDTAKIRKKVAEDEQKFLTDLRVKAFQVEQDQAAEAEATRSKLRADEDAARASVDQQIASLKKLNEESKFRLDLAQKTAGLSPIEAERLSKLLELERARTAEIKKADETNRGLPADRQLEAERRINDEFRARIGLINEEYDQRTKREEDWGAGFQDAMLKYKDSFTAFKQGGMVADSLFSNMSRSIDNFVNTGKFKFGDFARSIIQDLIRIEMKAIASYFIRMILGQFFTAGAYGTTPFSQQTSMLLAQEAGMGLPGRAAGGPVQSGMGYIVGERGPELFIPKTSGNIIPNNQLQTTPSVTNINYSISAVDASSFRSLVARDPQFIYSVTEKGRRSLPSRRMAV